MDKAGDTQVKIQGPLPSMTEILDKTAEGNDQKCVRYYMISHDVTMLCENEDGHVVATSSDDDINFESEDLVTKYRYIEEHLELSATDWRLHAEQIRNSAEWEETEPSLFPEADDNFNDDNDQPKLTSEKDTILVPGDSAMLALDVEDITISVATDLMVDQEDRDLEELHELLCDVIDICDPSNPTSVDKSKIKQTSYGQKYIGIYVLENANQLLESAFEIDVQTNGMQIKRRYFIYIQRRRKRATISYSKWVMRSIGDEWLFPYYGEHVPLNTRCTVRIGPVAWAMLFGYYDRRSHTYPRKYGRGSQGMYRCGTDGTTGSNACKAPSVDVGKTRKYMEKLRTILKTFCTFRKGSNWHDDMVNIGSFFKDRQSTGSPREAMMKPLLDIPVFYYKDARDSMIKSVKTVWPTVVSFSVNGMFSLHFSVVTKIRERTRTVEACNTFLWWTKCSTKSETHYDMYVHMGKSGAQNGWRKAETYIAVVDKY